MTDINLARLDEVTRALEQDVANGYPGFDVGEEPELHVERAEVLSAFRAARRWVEHEERQTSENRPRAQVGADGRTAGVQVRHGDVPMTAPGEPREGGQEGRRLLAEVQRDRGHGMGIRASYVYRRIATVEPADE